MFTLQKIGLFERKKARFRFFVYRDLYIEKVGFREQFTRI